VTQDGVNGRDRSSSDEDVGPVSAQVAGAAPVVD